MRLGRSERLRGLARIAPLVPAAFAVHQLRYLLAYGHTAGAELARTGHSYLHSFVPWIVLVLALSAGGFLLSLGRAFAGHRSVPRYTASLGAMWLACSATLIGLYACQELLEGAFATGHVAGFAGVFGFGGWWAIPSALCVGLVLAAWFHGARWVLRHAARIGAARRASASRPASPASIAYPALVQLPAPVPVVDGASGRGPPLQALLRAA